jgi:hypothetical protein
MVEKSGGMELRSISVTDREMQSYERLQYSDSRKIYIGEKIYRVKPVLNGNWA